MKKRLIRIGIVLFLLIDVGIIGYFLQKKFIKPEAAHFHAGFQVYIDDKLQDFSDTKYMETKPCANDEGDETKSPEELQKDKAHLHDNVGNVVHSHVKGGTWEDLFRNIKFNIHPEKGITAYVNGKEVKNILQYPIHPYDSAIILVGKHGDKDTYLKNAVTKAEILKEEKNSESCGIP
jgi:hypothetical protein